MILLVTPENRESFLDLLDQQYLARNKVFNNRLGWDLPTFSEREIDQYDRSDTYYLLGYHKDNGVYCGCRLLPTLTPYMLEENFPEVQIKQYPKTKRVWELSRFFVDTQTFKEQAHLGIKKATYELLIALQEFGCSRKIDSYFALADIRIERIFKMAGSPIHRVSNVINVGGTMSVAGYIKVSTKNYITIKKNLGIEDSVLIEC